MKNFQNGKIYTLRNLSTGKIFYCGSTCGELSRRKRRHRYASQHKTKQNYSVYQYINECGGCDSFDIYLHEAYPCLNNDELRKREGEVLEQLIGQGYDMKFDKVPYATPERNRMLKKEHDRRSYLKNIEKIKAYRQTPIHCECGSTVIRGHIARHKKSQKHIRATQVEAPTIN